MTIIYSRFRIITAFFFTYRTQDISNGSLRTDRNNRICSNVAYVLRKLQTSPLITQEFLGLRMGKFQGIVFM